MCLNKLKQANTLAQNLEQFDLYLNHKPWYKVFNFSNYQNNDEVQNNHKEQCINPFSDIYDFYMVKTTIALLIVFSLLIMIFSFSELTNYGSLQGLG